MSSKSVPKGVWADQPFKLLDTPGKDKSISDPVIYVASHMALVHNTFIRALNSIYMHAPLIASTNKSLVQDLLTYCQCWVALVDLHHQTEEKFFFSALEKRIPAAKGILATNVHQHGEFHDSLAKFEKYVQSALDGDDSYSSERLLRLIDGFSEPLMKHFNEEIPSLLRLHETGQGHEVMKVHEEFEVIVRKDIDGSKVGPMTLLNADKTFEGGKHPFPVMPIFVPYMIKYLVSRKYAGAWKFGSCDYWGQPVTLFMNTPEGKKALAEGWE